MSNDFLWVEKYRPRRIADTILPDSLKQVFQKIVDELIRLGYGEMERVKQSNGKMTIAYRATREMAS